MKVLSKSASNLKTVSIFWRPTFTGITIKESCAWTISPTQNICGSQAWNLGIQNRSEFLLLNLLCILFAFVVHLCPYALNSIQHNCLQYEYGCLWEYFTLPHVFRPDPRRIWVDSGRNGRNGRNLVGISCQWEPTQIWPGLRPNSNQIPTIPTKFTRIHADPSPIRFHLDSDHIPPRFHLDSDQIPPRFHLDSDQIPPGFHLDSDQIPNTTFYYILFYFILFYFILNNIKNDVSNRDWTKDLLIFKAAI